MVRIPLKRTHDSVSASHPCKLGVQELAGELKAEVREILSSHGISSFVVKPVQRSYAFEHPKVPHGLQWVLKVRYPATGPTLPLNLSGVPAIAPTMRHLSACCKSNSCAANTHFGLPQWFPQCLLFGPECKRLPMQDGIHTCIALDTAWKLAAARMQAGAWWQSLVRSRACWRASCSSGASWALHGLPCTSQRALIPPCRCPSATLVNPTECNHLQAGHLLQRLQVIPNCRCQASVSSKHALCKQP